MSTGLSTAQIATTANPLVTIAASTQAPFTTQVLAGPQTTTTSSITTKELTSAQPVSSSTSQTVTSTTSDVVQAENAKENDSSMY